MAERRSCNDSRLSEYQGELTKVDLEMSILEKKAPASLHQTVSVAMSQTVAPLGSSITTSSPWYLLIVNEPSIFPLQQNKCWFTVLYATSSYLCGVALAFCMVLLRHWDDDTFSSASARLNWHSRLIVVEESVCSKNFTRFTAVLD